MDRRRRNNKVAQIKLKNQTMHGNIKVTVYWRDKLGYLRNFYLPAGGATSMKLMFK